MTVLWMTQSSLCATVNKSLKYYFMLLRERLLQNYGEFFATSQFYEHESIAALPLFVKCVVFRLCSVKFHDTVYNML